MQSKLKEVIGENLFKSRFFAFEEDFLKHM